MGPFLHKTITRYKRHLPPWQTMQWDLSESKDISFLNNVITLFVFPLSVVCNPARCYLYHVTVPRKGPIAGCWLLAHFNWAILQLWNVYQSIVNILDAISEMIQSMPSKSFSPVTALHHWMFQWCVLMASRLRAYKKETNTAVNS